MSLSLLDFICSVILSHFKQIKRANQVIRGSGLTLANIAST